MSRILFIVPPLVGHTNPTVSVAAALEKHGHDVAWLGYPSVARPLLPPGAKLLPLSEERWLARSAASQERWRCLKGLESVLALFKDLLLPLALDSLDEVRHIVRHDDPDLLVVDQQALAGVAVALERERALGESVWPGGAPWVTSATTTASLFRSADGFVQRCLHEFQDTVGLAPRMVRPDLSRHGVLAFSTRELVGDVELYDVPYGFVGPCLNARPQTIAFPWERLRHDVPKVLVSLGTISIDRGPRYFSTVMEALAGEALQVIMVAHETLASSAPENFILRERVPQLELLPHLSAVVCHAGHNTVCEALAHGLPLVTTPIRDDQPIVARQVAAAGAGLTLRFKRLRPADLRDGVWRVISDPAFAAAAERIRASFERAGGAEGAAAFLEARLPRAVAPSRVAKDASVRP